MRENKRDAEDARSKRQTHPFRVKDQLQSYIIVFRCILASLQESVSSHQFIRPSIRSTWVSYLRISFPPCSGLPRPFYPKYYFLFGQRDLLVTVSVGWSVHRSVHLSVHWLVRRSVTLNDFHSRTSKRLNVIRAVTRAGVNKHTAIKLYKTYVLPVLEYDSIAFLAAPKLNMNKLQRIQNEAIRACLKIPCYVRTDLLHECAGLEIIVDRLKRHNLRLLNQMSQRNKNVHDLHISQLQMAHLFPKSPLDLLLS